MGWLKIPVAYAQCCWDCSYCDILPCTGNTCPGDAPKNGLINGFVSGITNNHSQIILSKKETARLIDGSELEERLRISDIFEKLDISQARLGNCYNTEETQRKALLGEERVIWKQLYSCSSFITANEWYNFYDQEDNLILDCYGPTSQDPARFDNYFCCSFEIF